MTKLSLEQMIEHSRKSDELYAESLRDEKLSNRTYVGSMLVLGLAIALVYIGQDWAVWLTPIGFSSPLFEALYVAPRRDKRLRWYRGNDFRGGE